MFSLSLDSLPYVVYNCLISISLKPVFLVIHGWKCFKSGFFGMWAEWCEYIQYNPFVYFAACVATHEIRVRFISMFGSWRTAGDRWWAQALRGDHESLSLQRDQVSRKGHESRNYPERICPADRLKIMIAARTRKRCNTRYEGLKLASVPFCFVRAGAEMWRVSRPGGLTN